MKNCILIPVLLFSFSLNLYAQEAVLSAGGDATGSGGSTSFSVGQVFYSINTGENGYLIQGVQQPYEISVLSSVSIDEKINLSLSLYPVPTKDYVSLEINNNEFEKMKYQLFDLRGNKLREMNVKTPISLIKLSDLAQGTYLLNVTRANKIIKTFKIIKQ